MNWKIRKYSNIFPSIYFWKGLHFPKSNKSSILAIILENEIFVWKQLFLFEIFRTIRYLAYRERQLTNSWSLSGREESFDCLHSVDRRVFSNEKRFVCSSFRCRFPFWPCLASFPSIIPGCSFLIHIILSSTAS